MNFLNNPQASAETQPKPSTLTPKGNHNDYIYGEGVKEPVASRDFSRSDIFAKIWLNV
jgi:hypothetical protein